PPAVASGNLGIVLCYSAFGFGYIIPATFLPTMARQLVSDPLVFGLTWPIFGAAAALSVAFAAHRLHGWPRRKVWAIAQGVMAAGTLLPLLQPALWVLAASAVLVGGTFMVTTMAGLQLARERMPANPTALLARMTTGFAAGQIAGPLLVRLVGDTRVAGLDALGLASATAGVLLAMTAIWLWRDDIAAATKPRSA
ncbi:MAG TPA: YbfB/YjiJ family MFS transporter, partial [Thauera aminoaromatica]|nr:YbfB/YjiJ family MFS transporter [Thauera aminoaromatica]